MLKIAGFISLIWVFSIILTALLSPLIVTTFRRRVVASMNAAALDVDSEVTLDQPQQFNRTSAGLASEAVLRPASTKVEIAATPKVNQLIGLANRKLRCIAAAYTLGGAVHALLTTGFFFAAHEIAFNPTSALLVALVLAVPIVPTVSYIMVARPGARIGWILGVLAAGLLIAGEARAVMIEIAKWQLLIPALIFLLFNLRFWRAVAPLILVLAASGSFGWLLGLELNESFGIESPIVWLFRLAGFVIGVGLALPVLRWIGAKYRAQAITDQELFIDSWWAVLTLMQAFFFLVAAENPAMLVSLASFPAYWLTKRLALRWLQAAQPQPGIPLLILRVFGHDRRTEKLLDAITLYWRCIGPINVIAGADLALHHVDPHDFYSFLSGRLSRAFVKNGTDLDQRLAAPALLPDPDGRYRINQFFCHRDTWKPALDGLVGKSAAVLMDLRGFDETKLGCSYELVRLGEHLGQKPIVLLANHHTDQLLVGALLRQGSAASRSQPFAEAQEAHLLDAERMSGRTLKVAMQLLLGATPRP